MKELKNKTEQEDFWAGEFGNDYTKRNVGKNWIEFNSIKNIFAKS